MCDVKELKSMLENELGKPGKWELLFREDDALIQGLAYRLENHRRIDNPFFQKARELGKPDTVYVREQEKEGWPTVPVLHDSEISRIFESAHCLNNLPHFYIAGEPQKFRLNPCEIRIGILVAGGNAAGLNMLVDSIVKRLTGLASEIKEDKSFRPEIIGYIGGYLGLKSGDHFIGVHGNKLTIEDTDPRAGDPCIFLKTLRGQTFADLNSDEARAELEDLATAVKRDHLNVLFVIGGNGTFTWANRIYETLEQKKYPIAVIGGPKTMDWDICFADLPGNCTVFSC